MVWEGGSSKCGGLEQRQKGISSAKHREKIKVVKAFECVRKSSEMN